MGCEPRHPVAVGGVDAMTLLSSTPACVGADPELFFPETGAHGTDAKKICRSCAVRIECLGNALEREGGLSRHLRHGILGGLSPTERARLAGVRE